MGITAAERDQVKSLRTARQDAAARRVLRARLGRNPCTLALDRPARGDRHREGLSALILNPGKREENGVVGNRIRGWVYEDGSQWSCRSSISWSRALVDWPALLPGWPWLPSVPGKEAGGGPSSPWAPSSSWSDCGVAVLRHRCSTPRCGGRSRPPERTHRSPPRRGRDARCVRRSGFMALHVVGRFWGASRLERGLTCASPRAVVRHQGKCRRRHHFAWPATGRTRWTGSGSARAASPRCGPSRRSRRSRPTHSRGPGIGVASSVPRTSVVQTGAAGRSDLAQRWGLDVGDGRRMAASAQRREGRGRSWRRATRLVGTSGVHGLEAVDAPRGSFSTVLECSRRPPPRLGPKGVPECRARARRAGTGRRIAGARGPVGPSATKAGRTRWTRMATLARGRLRTREFARSRHGDKWCIGAPAGLAGGDPSKSRGSEAHRRELARVERCQASGDQRARTTS